MPGTGRRSGLKPPLLVSRAPRWLWRDRKDAGILRTSKVPALHREAERDTTGNISRQHPVHTWIGRQVQGKRRSAATLDFFRRGNVKARLTLWFYCGKEGCSEAENRWRAAQITCFAGICAPVRRSIAVRRAAGPSAAEGASRQAPAAVPNFPIASDARLAGDAKQTRFVLDLDKPIRSAPSRSPIPIASWSIFPGRLPASRRRRHAGRGLVKAFRYGLVMPGGSRIVFDLTGPAKIANSYVLEAANGQPPRLVLELDEVDRAASCSRWRREPARTAAGHRGRQGRRRSRAAPQQSREPPIRVR